MIDLIHQPWPWYVSGPLIGLFIPLLLIIGNKQLGLSSSIKHICAACLPVKKISFFNYDWKKDSWSLFLVLGIILGGIITNFITDLNYEVLISDTTKQELSVIINKYTELDNKYIQINKNINILLDNFNTMYDSKKELLDRMVNNYLVELNNTDKNNILREERKINREILKNIDIPTKINRKRKNTF